jgi:predicted Zn-ribbon and HTH transcriptional regulator
MKFRRFLIAPLLGAALLFATECLYSSAQVVTTQQTTSAVLKKPARFQYVCRMHPDVKSNKPGKCPKCKMKLEKRRIQEPTASTDR